MIIVMEHNAPQHAIDDVARRVVAAGMNAQRVDGGTRTILAITGGASDEGSALWKDLPFVSDVLRVEDPYYLASRNFRSADTIVSGRWGNIGGNRPWLAIEPVGLGPGEEIPPSIAAGRPFDSAVVRGSTPPTPLGGLCCLSLDGTPENPDDVLFSLRAPSWGANTWIAQAERELEAGRNSVVLLEAGGEYPNGARTLEIAAIARAKQRTHLPIVVDASTIAQRTRYVAAVAQAAIAAGADGVVIRAWVGRDGQMPLAPATLAWKDAVALGQRLRAIAAASRG